MGIFEMKKRDVIMLFDQLWPNSAPDEMGEKDFFDFMKRANRDLTRTQRHELVDKTINMIRGEKDESE